MNAITFAVMLLAGTVFVARFLSRFVYVCRPNEVLIFSGRTSRAADGSEVGYRVVTGGWAFRMPVIETVHGMATGLIAVDLAVRNAYSKGGIPLDIHSIANVKISTDRRFLGNAVERFLGRDPAEIYRVAKETLEGHLRSIVANLTPEQVNEDRLTFAAEIAEEAVPDLHKLGLQLDTLKIQNVADHSGYLDSIGREIIAIVRRDAEIAESTAQKEAEQAEAEAQGRAQIARTESAAKIARLENELRRKRAALDADARTAEERAEGAARTARAEAELELQTIRQQVEALRLQAEVVIPADVERRAQELRAAGEAAPIAAQGEAAAGALRELLKAWEEAGPQARQIFLVQNSDRLLAKVAEAVARVKPAEVSLVDGGDGRTLPAYVTAYPELVRSVLNAVAHTTGIDLIAALKGETRTAEEG